MITEIPAFESFRPYTRGEEIVSLIWKDRVVFVTVRNGRLRAFRTDELHSPRHSFYTGILAQREVEKYLELEKTNPEKRAEYWGRSRGKKKGNPDPGRLGFLPAAIKVPIRSIYHPLRRFFIRHGLPRGFA